MGNSPHITKTNARRAIERVAEMRNGTVDVHNSVAGYCNNPGSENYGKIWALLSTEKGTIQYSGYADEALKRSTVKLGSNDFDSKRAALIESKSSEGFKDMTSGSLPLFPWISGASASYRGMKKSKSKCSKKMKSSCKSSKKSSKKKSSKKRKSRKSMKKSKSSKCNTLKSGKKRMKKSCKGPKCSWTKGSKGKKGYCHKSVKKSKKSMKKKSKKSKKSMKKKGKKANKCNTLK